jgi:hypothetical protein
MKKMILFFLIALFGITAVFAQQNRGTKKDPQTRAQHKVERFSQKVDLSQDKKEALISAFANHYEKKNQLKQQGRSEASKSQWKELRSSLDSQVKEILNSDQQYQAYQDFMEEEKAKHKRGGKKGGKHHKKN